jgi:hypothetical protein
MRPPSKLSVSHETRKRAENLDGPLFKFRSFDSERDPYAERQGGMASLLRDNLIYCPSPWELNDPWEGRPWFTPPDNHADSRRFMDACHELRKELEPDSSQWSDYSGIEGGCRLMQDLHHRKNKGLGIYSVCASITHPLQWSYYANGHRGYAWAFDNKLLPFASAEEVSYQSGFPEVISARWENSIRDSLLTKADHWKHEEEYRIILPEEPLSGAFDVVPYQGPPEQAPLGRYLRLPPKALLGVVFGANISHKHAGTILRLVREFGRDIEVRKCGTHRSKYEVAPFELAKGDRIWLTEFG